MNREKLTLKQKFRFNIWYPLQRMFDIKYKYLNVKWFIQRGKRGYADCDVWDISSYLTSITLPMLKRFKEGGHGYPGMLTYEIWDKKLATMIEAWEEARLINDGENFYVPDEYMQHKKQFELKIRPFITYFFHLWD